MVIVYFAISYLELFKTNTTAKIVKKKRNAILGSNCLCEFYISFLQMHINLI
jgi:hypothetical protein